MVCSSVTGAGLDELAAAIRRRLAERCVGRAGAETAARCLRSLREAGAALDAAAAPQLAGDELLAAELHGALAALGDVTGATCADDVLDRVFRQVCIGK